MVGFFCGVWFCEIMDYICKRANDGVMCLIFMPAVQSTSLTEEKTNLKPSNK